MKSKKLARPNFSFYWQSSGCPGSDLNFPRSNIRFSTFCPQKNQRILSPFQGISLPRFAQVRVGVCALYQAYTHGRLWTSHKRPPALCTHGCHWWPLCPTIPQVLAEGYIPRLALFMCLWGMMFLNDGQLLGLIFGEDHSLPRTIIWVPIPTTPFISCLSLGELIHLSFPLWKMWMELVVTLNRTLANVSEFIHVGNLE